MRVPFGIRLAWFFALIGLGLASPFAPSVGPLVVALLLAGVALARSTHPFVSGLLIFLVLQDPLQILAGGTSDLGLLVKRIDEPLVLLGGAACLASNRAARRAFLASGFPWALAALFAALAVSTIVANRPWFPAIFDAAMFSKPFMLLALGMGLAPSADDVDRRVGPILYAMLATVLFGVFFLAAPGLHEAYLGALGAPHERLGRFSAQGFFANPGTYSWFAAATFAFGYAAYLAYQRFAYLAAALTAAAFVLLSLRRKSILAVVAVLVVCALVRSRSGSRSRSILIVVICLVVGITWLAPFLSGLWVQTLEEYGGDDSMATARQALYSGSVLVAKDRFPFGAGWGTFGSYVSGRFYSDVYHEYGLSRVWGLTPADPAFVTDTFWPMVLGQGGAFAILAYFALFALLLRAAWLDARRPDARAGLRFLAIAALAVVVASLVESSASHVYGASLHAGLALIPAGIVWRLHVDRTRAVSEEAGTVVDRAGARPESG